MWIQTNRYVTVLHSTVNEHLLTQQLHQVVVWLHVDATGALSGEIALVTTAVATTAARLGVTKAMHVGYCARA